MSLSNVIKHIKAIIRRVRMEGMSNEEYVNYLRKHGVKVGKNVFFRHPSHTAIDFTRPCLVEIGDNLDINDNFTIVTHDFGSFVFRNYYKDFVSSSGKVKIGNNIVFGRGVTVLKGVEIGDNCIIGAGSIVSKSIPANSVAVGTPAKVVCSLDEYYQKRKTLQLQEALEYGKELALVKGGYDKIGIKDFPEEWVLFLSEEEYNNDNSIHDMVKFRLKDKIEIKEFLNRNRPFPDFNSFIDAIKKH